MKTKRFLAMVIAFCILHFAFCTFPTSAAEQGYSVDIATGDITLTETDAVKYANGTAYEGAITITDSDTTVANVITIESGEHNVTISSVTVKQISVAAGAKLNLTLKGESTITPDTIGFAAIHVPEGAELVITENSQGAVTATGESEGAGIGGSKFENSGKITICGGTVTATGAFCGAGIGGGNKGTGTNITISGGTVTATSVQYGAGIGGGSNSDGTNIIISGGVVTATGGVDGAGIGGGRTGDGTNITISGGTVIATGGKSGAGIGGGYGVYRTYGKNITISGGTVTAAGGEYAVAIGGQYTSPENVIVSPAQNCSIKVKETAGSTGIIGEYTVNTNIATAIADYINIYIYGHVDENDNHKCDVCDAYINDLHKDENSDHLCDVCKFALSECEDLNPVDHLCDVCNQVASECDFDENNGFCSVCGALDVPELKDNYYQIENAGQLFWFANHINTVDRTASAVLTADIDLENKPWTPIGSTGEASNNFRGVFDGQDHTITGLYVEGGRAGLGFFGEVRTGTVKNFTIYGNVVVNTEVNYVGGVIGSICGLNSTDHGLERNGAIIQNITSFVNVTAKAHGIGMIGGFVGYANHESLIEQCAWYGTFDAGEYRVDSGAGGFVGRIYDTATVTIRNCGAYGDIITAYKSGTYNNQATIYIGGFLSYSPSGANTVLENNLWAGRIINNTNLTAANAHLSAYGTMNSSASKTNCYALEGTPYVTTNDQYADDITAVTAQQLASGEVAYKLGDAFGQDLSKENSLPVLKGAKVYKYTDGYSNELKFGFADYTTDGAIFNIPAAGTYSLVFADYEGGRLNDIDIVPVTVTADTIGEITLASIKGITLGTGDKIMLWKDMTNLVPKCEAYIVK